MDISALVNHDGDAAVLPRRSLSNSHSVSVPSPVSVAAKLPSTPNTTRRQMPLKRKRYDPKPIWAYRENESLPPELQRLLDETQSQRAPPPAVQQPTPQQQAQPGAHPQGNGPASNGHGAPAQRVATGLVGYERPISDTAHVYDEVSRTACDFIFNNAVNNEMLRNAIAESEHTQLEIEARWGHIIDKGIGQRLRGYHDSETIIKSQQIDTKFESTMTEVQHKRMNEYLNGEVEKSRKPGASRDAISYKHTYEVDMFYDLGQDQFKILPPAVQGILQMAGQRQRIRVTRDRKTNQVLRSMIKHRIANLDISSPRTEWDYRIGINLEINYPGPVEELKPVVEAGKTPESMKRQKDRMSYSYLGAFQIDLTQVVSGPSKNHELELELNSDVLLENADKMNRDMPNDFEHLINGMMNNLRIMSRQIT